MRLTMRLAVGLLLVSGAAFSTPADDQAQSEASTAAKPGKLGHLFMFHKTTRRTDTSSKSTAAKPQALKHTDGFPEPDKKGAQYQPQTVDNQIVGEMWKTNRNKDTFKQQDDAK